MRLSREKTNRLARAVIDHLVLSEDVEFIEDRETIRQEILQILQSLLRDEEKVDAAARQKIASQKKEIPEGSAEWDVLYRKYYAEELRKIGVGEAG